jgi:hypothetical protein
MTFGLKRSEVCSQLESAQMCVCMSVCHAVRLALCNNSKAAERIFRKFYKGEVY